MPQFFKKPNPYNEDLRQNVKLVFFISLGVLGFLALFQPINLVPFTRHEIIYFVGGTSVTTFLVLIFNIIILPSLFPKLFFHKNKSFVRDLFWNIWILVSLSLANLFLYLKIFDVNSLTYEVITQISLLGFIPLTVLVITNHFRSLRAQLRQEKSLNAQLREKKENHITFVHFESEYKNDNLIINPETLFLIKSADNYIEVFYESEGEMKNKMIRSSLVKAESLLSDYKYIIRTQRSYIVNINQIKEIQNIPDGYKLLFQKSDLVAYVSQKYMTEFKKMI
ncbi:MAG: ypdB 3 [Bacteroidetes bacterium]|nr:ypdB 3 [Bacteroidota bacterium]